MLRIISIQKITLVVSTAILNASGDVGNVGKIASDDFMLRFCLLIYFWIIFTTSNSTSTWNSYSKTKM